MRRILCGTPRQHCSGSTTQTNAFLRSQNSPKTHSTPPEAFRCYSRYLTGSEGYERIGGREFRKDGQPVLVLTKQSKFGAELRPGKGGEKTSGSRFMPKSGGGVLL